MSSGSWIRWLRFSYSAVDKCQWFDGCLSLSDLTRMFCTQGKSGYKGEKVQYGFCSSPYAAMMCQNMWFPRSWKICTSEILCRIMISRPHEVPAKLSCKDKTVEISFSICV